MAMARAVEDLVCSQVEHACGLPVETVLADGCIGGAAEAAACEAKFQAEGVGLSLTVTNCWCYGAETFDMNPVRPKAIWGFNGTERPGAVYLAAALAGYSQKGLPCFGIYGRDVQDLGDAVIPADCAAKILRFVRAGLVVATMRDTAYLGIGGTSMGIAGSSLVPSLWEKYFGMRVETVDMTEVLRRVELGIFDAEELAQALEWTKTWAKEGRDPNSEERRRSREQKDADWEMSVKMAIIFRDLMIGNPLLADLGFPEEACGHGALAAGFQGQRQWTDHWPNGDFPEAILNSSFDWSGIRQPFVFATENDALNAASMLFGHLLTGAAQLFSDVRTFWSPEAVRRVTGANLEGQAAQGFLHLINSGPSALDWTGESLEGGMPVLKRWNRVTPADAAACLEATQWCAANLGYFRGGGWSTDFTTRGGMPVTMCRLNLVDGLGPVLQIAEGHTIDLPAEVHRALDERTDPTWPSTWFVPRTTGQGAFRDVYSVMAAWGANHGAICYGHVGADLLTLASMFRIPVDMHNVPEEMVFRPAVWSRFGTMEPQGADYRACQRFGPLYT